MFKKKKIEIAKRLAVICYIIEKRASLEDIEGDGKIVSLTADIAADVGGIKMLNTVMRCLEELRQKEGGQR